MKIGIDVRCLAEGRRTGVEEYTLNVLRYLFEIDRKNDYVLFLNSFREPEASLNWIEKYSNVTLKKIRFPNKLLNLFFWYFGWPKIDKMLGGVDVFFMPNITFFGLSGKTKLISTIHDLSFERYPEFFSIKRRLWHVFVNPKKICRRANKIIAVSESTKKDLISLYKINADKIEVIHNGLAEKFRVINRNDEKLIKVKEKYQLPYKFILYFGTIEPRKNVISVLKAFEGLKSEFSHPSEPVGPAHLPSGRGGADFKLVIAGSDGWSSEEAYFLIKNSCRKDEIILINNVQEEDKEYFYNLASVFVYPSFFEGFGFPPLEAMACGIPVIASNNSSVAEIVGEAGTLIDPAKPQEIFQALQEIISSKDLREKLVQKGLQKAKEFQWKAGAEDLLKLCYNLENNARKRGKKK